MIYINIRYIDKNHIEIFINRLLNNCFRLFLCVFILLTSTSCAPDPWPLIKAINKKDKRKIDELLNKEPSLAKTRVDTGFTPLHFASRQGDEKLIKRLIDLGADVNSVSRIGSYTPLHEAVISKNPNAVKILLKEGAINSINKKCKGGFTPLHLAVIESNSSITEELIKHGANIKMGEKQGNTPLHLAVIQRDKKMVAFLLRYDDVLTIKNNKGETPLDIARKKSNKEIIKLLEDKMKEEKAKEKKTKGAKKEKNEGKKKVEKKGKPVDAK